MKYSVFLVLVVLFSCVTGDVNRIKNFPHSTSKPNYIPAKENFHVYIMAGQSNMAGRGYVKPKDTLPNQRILVLNQQNEWVVAKEPLHYYEPTRTGLDCGLAFAKQLIDKVSKEITIGLIPCAVGGSSVSQWLGDSTYRSVTLMSNLRSKVKVAGESGTIKAMIWHQGESDANELAFRQYHTKAIQLFTDIRQAVDIPDMPIFIGTLGDFLPSTQFPRTKEINQQIKNLPNTLTQTFIVSTENLKPKSDTIHFKSSSVRALGRRYAEEVVKTVYHRK